MVLPSTGYNLIHSCYIAVVPMAGRVGELSLVLPDIIETQIARGYPLWKAAGIHAKIRRGESAKGNSL